MTAFFDTSAVIALADQQSARHQWAMDQFVARKEEGLVFINDIVYAELSAGFASQIALDALVQRFGLERAARNNGSLYAAGQRFKLYKKNSGPKTNVLSDFFIGAAAQALSAPLVTANPKDFRGFFSGLVIVHPDGEETVS